MNSVHRLPFIVFIPFILNFPTGLMIYWLTTNLWTTGQGLVTRKMMPRPNLGAQAKSSRTPPKEPPAAPAKTTSSKRKPGVPGSIPFIYTRMRR